MTSSQGLALRAVRAFGFASVNSGQKEAPASQRSLPFVIVDQSTGRPSIASVHPGICA